MLDLQTKLCYCCGRAELGTRKRKHPCLTEAGGWHLQGMLAVSSMEGCVSPTPKTHWSKVGNCLGESLGNGDLAASVSQKEAGKQHDCPW